MGPSFSPLSSTISSGGSAKLMYWVDTTPTDPFSAVFALMLKPPNKKRRNSPQSPGTRSPSRGATLIRGRLAAAASTSTGPAGPIRYSSLGNGGCSSPGRHRRNLLWDLSPVSACGSEAIFPGPPAPLHSCRGSLGPLVPGTCPLLSLWSMERYCD